MNPRKCFALLFLSTLALYEYAANAEEEEIKVGVPVTVNVSYPAKVAVPIQFTSGNYQGPYDPLDPKGVNAARHRRMKIAGEENLQVIKSYIPPGIDKVAKKEVIKVAVKEGERFAFAHPKETADLIGIATRAKHLYHTASEKLKKLEKN